MTVELICGDCLEVMRGMEAGSVDVIVTDPPYGIGENNRKNLSREKLAKPRDYGAYTWDAERLAPEYIHEMLRVSKQQVIFGGNYYADLLPPSSSWIVWDKLNGQNDFADCELAWTSYRKAVRKFTYMWSGFIKQQPEERYHPTQKPLSLMEWILLNYTNPGDVVFDPFMGSGTTGVAAVKNGRGFIGVDKDKVWLPIAQRRIAAAQSQPALFV